MPQVYPVVRVHHDTDIGKEQIDACAVPSRRIRSVYGHVQRAYHPRGNDLFVKEHKSDWTKIGEAIQRMPESCRGRYQQYLVYTETERK
ncbi:hypothetical protein EDB83DRAFT_2348215, partial [Lactarius deliciosus]